MIEVIMPNWWTECAEEIVGYTDGVITFCCSSTPTYFVEVPEFNWSGYINASDLNCLIGNEELLEAQS